MLNGHIFSDTILPQSELFFKSKQNEGGMTVSQFPSFPSFQVTSLCTSNHAPCTNGWQFRGKHASDNHTIAVLFQNTESNF